MYHNNFFTFKKYFGLIANDGEGTRIFGYENVSDNRFTDRIKIENNGGCYGFVPCGSIKIAVLLNGDYKSFWIDAGYWFSTPSGFYIENMQNNTRLAIFQKQNYIGQFAIGLIEEEGRLKYIDGCKDTLVSAPIKKGFPCLNALYMPENVNQTMHTHPSTRAGIIIVGGAKCETPEKVTNLETGDIFFLPKNGWHKFRSDEMEKGIVLKLVAFHPDSDFGPTDEEHPMLNRTLINEVSAKHMEEIRTK